MKDDTSQDEKAKELSVIAANILPIDIVGREEIAATLVSIFCQITPPEYETSFHLITLDSRGGGISRKPGNIVLNWRRLFTSIPNIVLTGVGAVALPWLWPFAVLAIWNEVWGQSKIELSQRHGIAIAAMWENRSNKQRIGKSEALTHINDKLTEYGYPEMVEKEFCKIIADLEEMQCIETDGDEIWLREWVKRAY